MPRPSDPLSEITSRTLAHYEASAEPFRAGTASHDVTQNYDALLRALSAHGAAPPYTLLDFGCGPGRDLAHFRRLGHEAVGLEGCEAFVKMARETGCEVICKDFVALGRPEDDFAHVHAGRFDGIFANASLFHVPSAALPSVLSALGRALKPSGILFSSNPRSAAPEAEEDATTWQEGWSGGRYGAYYGLAAWRQFVTAAGFEEVEHYYRPPGKPRAEQPWLASVWRKLG